jgi:glycine cleavage system protein P-like pyridoxal-binding family
MKPKRETCPCCHRPLPVVKDGSMVSILDMTDAQLFAYYKKQAPRSDLAFTARNASPELKARIQDLLSGNPSAKDAELMRHYRRVELSDAEKASGMAPIGSERWRNEQDTDLDVEVAS